LHAIDGRLAEPSQYAPQYLLPDAARQLQPGCAHFSIFFSVIKTFGSFSVAEKDTPTHIQNQSLPLALLRLDDSVPFGLDRNVPLI